MSQLEDNTSIETDLAMRVSSRRRAGPWTQIVLVSLVLCASGFIGGILTAHRVEEAQSSVQLPGGISLPAGIELPEGIELPSGGAGGALPGAEQLAALTGGKDTYTVAVVDGDVLYLKDNAGVTVKVITASTTRIRHLAKGSVADLRPGDVVELTGDSKAGEADGTTDAVRAKAIDQTG
jgi:hypothetical protein